MTRLEKAIEKTGMSAECIVAVHCPSSLLGVMCKCQGNCRECWSKEYKGRVSKDEYYLGIAEAVSRRSTCLRRQYGAVIVKDDEILATGYNGAPRGEANCCDTGSCRRRGHAHNDGDYSSCPAVHAEQNAVISAARRDMIGATLYLWGGEGGRAIDAEPCPICARMIKNAGIGKVVCGRGV